MTFPFYRAFRVKWDGTNWSDLTADLRQMTVNSCRRSLTSATWQPGSATFVLDNRDRTYDPLFTTGAYYGDLDVGKLVEIRVGASLVVSLSVWRGWIDRISFGYDPRTGDATVTLECIDAMARLGRASVPAGVTPSFVNGESVSDRAEAILAAAGVTDITIGNSGVTFGSAGSAACGTYWDATRSHNVLEALQSCADLEAAPLVTNYLDPEVVGDVHLAPRYWFQSSEFAASPYFTFGDMDLAPMMDVNVAYGGGSVLTAIAASSDNGLTASSSNSTTIAAYGVTDGGVRLPDLPAQDAGELKSTCNTWLALHQSPGLWVESIRVRPNRFSNLALAIYAIHKTSWIPVRVTVTFSPPGGGSAISADSFVIGWTHTADAEVWDSTYYLMPTAPYDAFGDRFIIGSSLIGGTDVIGF